MKDPSKVLTSGILHSLTGLGVQVVFTGILVWITATHPKGIFLHALWTSLAGLLPWMHLAVTYSLLRHEARCGPPRPIDKMETDEEPSTPDKGDRIRSVHRIYQRYFLPVMELGAAALLMQSTLAWLRGDLENTSPAAEGDLFLIAVFSVSALALVVFTAYFSSIIKNRPWYLLKSGRNYTLLMSALLLVLLAGACSDYYSLSEWSRVLGWALVGLNTLLAAENLFSLFMRLFAPRKRDELPRPSFDFYVLEAVARPGRVGKTFSAMLEGIFGFDIADTSLVRVARSLLAPALLLSGGLLIGLSSIVIVRPHEQALLLDLGSLQSKTLGPGIHFKRPWPLAEARLYDVCRIRSIHVGSHKSDQESGGVFREGVPILWTNMHGLNIDELLICSSPKALVDRAEADQFDQKAPSVSLAAADVRVQYVIDDLLSYVGSSGSPDEWLRNISESHASRFIFRHDIDALFCDARLSLADELRSSIQESADRESLGVKIVHVAITAVHPPVEVAGAFEETVAALQEHETMIQQAEQNATRVQIETTGSTEDFARIGELVESAESGHGGEGVHHEKYFQECGGEVSRILAQAEAYRFTRENMERAKTERFAGQLKAFEAAPLNFRYDRYFSILEDALMAGRKVVLLCDKDRTVIRMGIPGETLPGSIPAGMEYSN